VTPQSSGGDSNDGSGPGLRGRIDVSPEGAQYAPGDVSDCAAVMEFDPATLVLARYGRMNGGTVRGDSEVAGWFRSLIVPI
jgi:hypothetical protein